MASTQSKTFDGELVTFQQEQLNAQLTAPDIRLLHYNDVYHLDPSSAEPQGGVARFVTAYQQYRDDDRFEGQPGLVNFFSGDIFNPSLESSITKGSHMIPFLNNVGTACACVGNHDLDFGVDQFQNLASQCNFPWLLANVLDPALGENVPLGRAKRTHIIETSNGIKLGLIGLGEKEWLETINTLPPNLIFIPPAEAAKELTPQLRAEGADIIIALTHMREPNDKKLAEETDGLVDIILGGHDHFYAHHLINGTHVLRSGTDFKNLSYIEARRSTSRKGRWDIDIYRRDLVSSIPEDGPTLALVDKLTSLLKKSLQKPIGWTAAPLDARFVTVRLKESNLGNFVCDIMKLHHAADCAIIASGTIRGDQIYTPGPIRVKDITDCFPFEDPVVLIRASGQAIWDALENSVSMYPALEGRFPQVAGLRFEFDPAKDAGKRVSWVEIGDGRIELDRKYVVATRDYMVRGKDGFESLMTTETGGTCEELVAAENGILISMMLRQYFMALKTLGQWMHWGQGLDRHWNHVVNKVDEKHPHIQPDGSRRSSVASKADEPAEQSAADTSAQAANATGRRKSTWLDLSPAEMRDRRATLAPIDEHNEGHGDDEEDAETKEEAHETDHELSIMRKVVRKWSRLAGVRGRTGEHLPEEEFTVNWTRAIAPRVEGRIIMVGGEVNPSNGGKNNS